MAELAEGLPLAGPGCRHSRLKPPLDRAEGYAAMREPPPPKLPPPLFAVLSATLLDAEPDDRDAITPTLRH